MGLPLIRETKLYQHHTIYLGEERARISHRCCSGTEVQFLACSTIADASIKPKPNEWLTARDTKLRFKQLQSAAKAESSCRLQTVAPSRRTHRGTTSSGLQTLHILRTRSASYPPKCLIFWLSHWMNECHQASSKWMSLSRSGCLTVPKKPCCPTFWISQASLITGTT